MNHAFKATAHENKIRRWQTFTPPQRSAHAAHCGLVLHWRAYLRQLRLKYPILEMPEALLREMGHPPRSPRECIFARTTETISADLRTPITPCQFGGNPDCGQCGCIASMGLAAVGHYRVLGTLTAGHLFMASDRLGKGWRSLCRTFSRWPGLQAELPPFNIIES